MFDHDDRIILTLDAGGTNFVFTAVQGNRFVVSPVTKQSNSDNLDKCLKTIVDGFTEIKEHLPKPPVAISFAFPGPADYANGVIGDLPNFPSFRGRVPLGPLLQDIFKMPVFINNDGNLFAYGEAISGMLPEINSFLEKNGNQTQYKNLIGITLGTGFGSGVVIDKNLLFGDNGCGGDVWVLRNKYYQEMIAEESVSIRAVKRVYAELSQINDPSLEPKDICDIAEGVRSGDREAAIGSFRMLGEAAGDVLAHVATLIDGLVVIGGGLTGASKYIYPALFKEIRSKLGTFAGDSFPRMQSEVFNLDDKNELAKFAEDKRLNILIPNTNISVPYNPYKKIGIGSTRLGTNHAVVLGAYAFALAQLDK